MFGLMTEREHESIMLDLECELVHERKQGEALVQRIQLGEDYRARLEYEIESTKRANRELVRKMDELGIELDEKKARIDRLVFLLKEKELMIGSLEARYRGKDGENGPSQSAPNGADSSPRRGEPRAQGKRSFDSPVGLAQDDRGEGRQEAGA